MSSRLFDLFLPRNRLDKWRRAPSFLSLFLIGGRGNLYLEVYHRRTNGGNVGVFHIWRPHNFGIVWPSSPLCPQSLYSANLGSFLTPPSICVDVIYASPLGWSSHRQTNEGNFHEFNLSRSYVGRQGKDRLTSEGLLPPSRILIASASPNCNVLTRWTVFLW